MKKKPSGITLVELLVIATILLVLGIIVAVPFTKVWGVPITYSDGDRTGVVYKISKKGFYWKTWEGELNLGGMSTDGNGTAVPNRWAFSAANDSIASQLTEAARNGERITLHYKQPLVVRFSQGETKYIVDRVTR